jgi:hypothetical protein
VARHAPKKDAGKPVIEIKGQLTLQQVVKPPAPDISGSSGEEDAPAAAPGTGTWGFPFCNTKEETTMISFRHHLTSIDEKSKSEKMAHQMATDVSTFF